MLKTIILLDIVLSPKDGYPSWLVILLALLAGLGIFWTKIKSWFEARQAFGLKVSEKKLDKKLQHEEKKIERELAEIDSLKKRVSALEAQNLKLIKANTAYATTMMLIIDQYEKENPDNKTLVSQMKLLIKKTLSDESTSITET